MRTCSLFFTALAALASQALAAEPTAEQALFFESKIRPILSDKCYKCHSVEKNKSKGGLTLDTREGTLKGGESGAAIKPGDVERSLLIKAVMYTDKDLQMPPKGEKLSAGEIADLTSWIKMGAPDPRKVKGKLSGLSDKAKLHWAFQPVKKPEIPVVKNRAWCITPVDAFIIQKIEEKRMAPSPSANKETLLRRATYDLTGLPPTPSEIAAFIADQAPDAFAKVVDRLLASPQYGERWGRYWLDTARYADTGGVKNGDRQDDYRYPYAWTYRDWVIKAFNDDMPYDQFVAQQLAADKIPNNAKPNLAALGFLTVGEKFENINDVINDRIDVVSKGFLGLTVSCARCHDHMFDPIPTKDYYALHGVFASTVMPKELPVLATAGDPKLQGEFNAKIAAVVKDNQEKYYGAIAGESNRFREKARAYLLAIVYSGSKEEATLKKASDLQENEKLDGTLANQLRRFVRPDSAIFGPLLRFSGPVSEGKKMAESIATDSKVNPIVAAAFKGTAPGSLEDAAGIYGKVFSSVDAKAAGLMKEFVATGKTNDPDAFALAFAPFRVVPAAKLADIDSIRDEAQTWVLQVRNRARFEFAKANELEMTHDGATVRAMAVVDSAEPKDSPVFVRGQAGVRGDMVPRRFLEVLSHGKPQPFKDGSGRLELAQAIASKDNPLTARVIVNRIWMHHFGQGFVRTPDDLGTQSEAPSHPELVDYLASYFMEQGWSFKKLHKLIMLSHVYQESSYTIAAQEKMDPENRLLWRANVRRLDFEAFRDSLLVMSGRLDKKLGGQPVNLTDEPYSYRRSVYGYVDRGDLPELMQNFDFSRPDMPNSARTTTIVPQQALFLMNSPMVIDVARQVLTQPKFVQAGADFKRIQAIYVAVYSRYPVVNKAAGIDEIADAAHFISAENAKQAEIVKSMEASSKAAQEKAAKQSAALAASTSATKAIQNEGKIVDRRPLNGWETFVQTLLFSNEAAYVN